MTSQCYSLGSWVKKSRPEIRELMQTNLELPETQHKVTFLKHTEDIFRENANQEHMWGTEPVVHIQPNLPRPFFRCHHNSIVRPGVNHSSLCHYTQIGEVTDLPVVISSRECTCDTSSCQHAVCLWEGDCLDSICNLLCHVCHVSTFSFRNRSTNCVTRGNHLGSKKVHNKASSLKGSCISTIN